MDVDAGTLLPLADRERLRSMVADLAVIFDVVETLHLNAETRL